MDLEALDYIMANIYEDLHGALRSSDKAYIKSALQNLLILERKIHEDALPKPKET